MMEVETASVPSFDLNSATAQPFSSYFATDRSLHRSPDSPENEAFRLADNGELKCEAPKSEAAMKVQKFYKGYRTRRLLADSAVVAEELWYTNEGITKVSGGIGSPRPILCSVPDGKSIGWWQAINFARLSHSTISFFNFLKPETVSSRWSRISLNASKVGQGLSKDCKAQKLAFQHWIEAIDPRHRYGHNLHMYYEEWFKGDAGQPFFYWLDVGGGKEVELPKCPRIMLRQLCVKYLGPLERKNYEYYVVGGKVAHTQSGKCLDTNKGLSGVKWIFVMSTSKRLFVGEKKKGIFHHSSFLAGGATLAAGRLVVENGTVKSISAYSGHYRPTDERLNSFLSFLKDNGVNLDEVEIHKGIEDYENNEEGQSNTDAITDKVLNFLDEKAEEPRTEIKISYTSTVSGGLHGPKTEIIPKTVILQRIKSKNAARSYELGHQLASKWSTGAGPRIGCIADYPAELRLQALEFTNLTPKKTT